MMLSKYLMEADTVREDGRLERHCEHGVGHTIGHINWKELDNWSIWVHGCDGCCEKWEDKMALIIVFHNDSTGTGDIANYNVSVYVNQRPIASGHIKDHRRTEGWRQLVRRLADPNLTLQALERKAPMEDTNDIPSMNGKRGESNDRST